MHFRNILFLAVAVLVLNGCDQISFNPEAKINAAYPISQQLQLTKNDTLAQVDEARRQALSNEFDSRMKVRALTCAKGYSPSWYTSADEVRKNIADQNCFANSDTETNSWLGLIRAGVLLGKPALVAIPDSPPKYIVADGYIQSASFAEAAGVAALGTSQGLQVVDVVSGKQLFQAQVPNRDTITLSQNGQVLAAISDGKLVLYSVQAGQVIAEQPVKATRFYWLTNDTGVYASQDNKVFFIDFLTGKTNPIAGMQGWFNRVVPTGNNQFLFSFARSLSRIEVKRTPAGAEAALMDEKPLENVYWNQNTSGLLADGSKLFFLNRDLFLVSLADLSQQKITFIPYQINAVVATPDPDRVILTGYSPVVTAGARHTTYEYSFNQQTLFPVDESQLVSQRFIFIPALKKIGIFSESKIALVDRLPTGEPVQLSAFVSEAAEAESLRKIEEFERRQSYMSAPGGGYYPPVASMAAPSMPMAAAPMAPGVVDSGYTPLASIARDARIEGIGVYQGTGSRSAPVTSKKSGVVVVTVKKSATPIILSLSSYEPVRWMLVTEPGARISAVLLSGYNQSQVINAGAARVVTLGSNYAYDRSSSNYAKLDNDVYRMTGKRLSLFQGRYEASQFSVGGY